MTEPSRVLHLRYAASEVSEDDILELIRPFGGVQKMVLLQKNRALLEMEDLAAAGSVMRHYSVVAAKIKGEDVYLQFSIHHRLREPSSGITTDRRRLHSSRVLWMTIHNPRFHVPLEAFHGLFSRFGFVEKIIIFQTATGPQALLQFSVAESAIQARNSLHGRDVYDACCTLDIKFSDCQGLHVSFNCDRMWDYTVDLRQPPAAAQQALDKYACRYAPDRHTISLLPVFRETLGGSVALYPRRFRNSVDSYGTGGGTILVSSLNPIRMDADRIFNLFSNYGDVSRVEVLQTMPDVALVQMEDAGHAEMAVRFLDGVALFGRRMQVVYSGHTYISGSPLRYSAREFQSSNRNRFHRYSSRDFNYRHCCAPTPMLHVSRLAPDVDEDEITSHLAEHGTIIKSRVFEFNGKRQALILFESVEQCTEALVSKHATMLKARAICLSFSNQTTV